MPKILGVNELDLYIRDFIECGDFYYYQTRDFFKDLYITGCRPCELLEPERWSIKEGFYELITAKTGAVRKIPYHFLSDTFKGSLTDGYVMYDVLSYSKVQLEFKRLFPLPKVNIQGKVLELYLFRHNRAKVMYKETNDIKAVQLFFAWGSVNMAENYIFSTIEY